MTIDELQRHAVAYRAEHPEQRWGQALFNVLAQHNVKLARELTGTAADPFYLDERVGGFLLAVEGRI